MRNLTNEEKMEIMKCFGCPSGEDILTNKIDIDDAILSFRYKIFLGRLKDTKKVFVFNPFENIVFDILTEEEFPVSRFINCNFIDSIGSTSPLTKDFIEQVKAKLKIRIREKVEIYISFYKNLLNEEIKVLDKTLYTKNFYMFVTLATLANIKNNTKEARVSFSEDEEFKKHELENHLKSLLSIKDERMGSIDVHVSAHCVKVKKPKKLSLLLDKNSPIFFDDVVLAS
ncbi:MAG: hypothetical protein RBS24_07010 [Bacilli bacterium]|nr:hypothetical protein [Bacilli bacterium]